MRAALLLLACAIAASADIIHLKNGGSLEGKIVDDAGDSITLQTKTGGVMHVKKADVDSIEKKPFEVQQPAPPKENPPSAGGGETFEDPIAGYRLQFPKGWRRAPNEKALTYAAPKEGDYQPRIDVRIVPRTGTIEAVVQQVKEAHAGLKVDTEGERKIAGAEGHRAWEVFGTFPLPNKPGIDLVSLEVTIEANEKANFLILGYCSKATFAKHAEEFKAVVDSFTLTPAAKLTPEQQRDFSTWLVKAKEASAKGDDAGTIEAYKKAAEIIPTFTDLHHNLAVLYLKTKKVDEAILEYQILTNLRPGNADDWYTLGTLYTGKQKFEDAARCLKKAIEIDPRHGSAWNNLGTVLLAKGDAPGAIQAFKRAAEIQTNDASPLTNLGKAYESTNQIEAAKEAFQKALDRDPANAEARAGLDRLSKPK